MEPGTQLESWSQAFEEYTVMQTRGIERQLRNDIAHSKEKLRGLVGGSYRELLATAEIIVALDTQLSSVEAQISELGRNCKPRQYAASKGAKAGQFGLAQLNLLHKCSSCISRSIKNGQIILAAKLLAVSRLLHTSLSNEDESPKILDALRDQLTSSRRLLLRRIDRRLEDVDIITSELIDVVSAFCLATSSSSNDAVRHFQHLRLEQIRQQAQSNKGHVTTTTQTFKYYLESLRTTKSFLGRDIPEALRTLQHTAILEDGDVQRLETLNLSMIKVLVPMEIQTFTPYIKRSNMSQSDVNTLVESWSDAAFSIFGESLANSLEALNDPLEVFTLRRDLMNAWLPVCFSVPAQSEILNILRETFNGRIATLIRLKVSTAEQISSKILAESEDHSQSPSNQLELQNTEPAIWSSDFVTKSLKKGTTSFLKDLQTHHLGMTEGLRRISISFQDWCQSVKALQVSLEELQQIRWQDIIEEPEEDQEDIAKDIVSALSQEDPQTYSKTLQSSLGSTLSKFQQQIHSASEQASDDQRALLLLRTIRDVSIQLTASFPNIKLSKLFSAIPALHELIATEIVSQLSTAMKSRPESQSTRLPDGLPSPTAFRTLRQLCAIMVDVGGVDIWTVTAVTAIKKAVSTRIFQEDYRKWFMVSQFDEVYLSTALDRHIELTESKAVAVEYWTRTKMLFGVLTP